jgi:hypothetical protein
MKIAHIINPVKVNKDNKSYLYYAQPITFESMKIAKKVAEKKNKDLKIELFAIYYPEDQSIVPEYFKTLPYLKKAICNDFPHITKRKLPYLQEIFDNVKKNVVADYYIYSNSDITLHSNFYTIVKKKLNCYKSEALIINRRDNIPKFINNIRFNKDHLSIITHIDGNKHPGRDCFVMSKKVFFQIDMKHMFIAAPPWGLILMKYLNKIAKNFKLLRNEYITYHIGCDNDHNNNQKTPLTKLNYTLSKDIIFDNQNK